MEFLFTVIEYVYSFFYGIYAVLSMSITDLILLSSSGGVVTITSFVNVFSHETVTLSLSNTVYNLLHVPLTFTYPLFALFGAEELPIAYALLITIPVLIIIGFVFKSIKNALDN